MLLAIDNVLSAEELAHMRGRYDAARFGDGRATAGELAAQVKRNLQLRANDAEAAALTRLVHGALGRNAQFVSAALPRAISPPLFNRYVPGMQFGTHVDNAIRIDSAQPLRADVAATLFLSQPDEYEGGTLVIEDVYGEQRIKLAAGNLVLYPASSLHRVEPISAGQRDVAVFWVQSMVRDDAQRAILLQLDRGVQSLRERAPGSPEIAPLLGGYHNLLRMWAEL